ncbi:hypothetical protein PINS_up020590 [Pythium insidiosum]|nr:hypothetical protein PINS_up020590 [Pythium insidiosum]
MTKPVGKAIGISKVDGVVRLSSPNSWMSTEAFIAYVDFIFPFVAPNTLLLAFDFAKSHISKKLTPYLQPCDYAFLKPLKDAITESIDAWKRAGEYELTRGGNPKPPRESVVAE